MTLRLLSELTTEDELSIQNVVSIDSSYPRFDCEGLRDELSQARDKFVLAMTAVALQEWFAHHDAFLTNASARVVMAPSW